MRVIAKAYSDRPLDRVAVGTAGNVVYIAAHSVADSMADGDPGGVGFPKNCVFAFDANLFSALERAWDDHDESALAELWARAVPATLTVRVDA